MVVERFVSAHLLNQIGIVEEPGGTHFLCLLAGVEQAEDLVPQKSSSIGLPLGKTEMGRPVALRYCCSVSTPRCW
jgi:hypothetical protein